MDREVEVLGNAEADRKSLLQEWVRESGKAYPTGLIAGAERRRGCGFQRK